MAETADPGFGFDTLTAIIPPGTTDAVPDAVSRVVDTHVVVSAAPPYMTMELGTKPVPLTVIVNAPGPTEAGLNDEIDGTGFRTVTVAELDAVTSATLVAATTTGVLGGTEGAVYSPSTLIVPAAELPPGTPLTLQVTALFADRITVGVKRCCVSLRTETNFGRIPTMGAANPETADIENDKQAKSSTRERADIFNESFIGMRCEQ
jgi:hypothetical protein